MTYETKLQRIRTLRYIIASRWFLHAGIVLLGLIQKAIGVAEFDSKIFALVFFTYSYNAIFYFYIRRDPHHISQRGIALVSLVQVLLDQLVYTVVLYASGGVESLSFLFYFLTIFIAIIIFNEFQIIALTFWTVALYVGLITLEYQELIPHFPRYYFDPGFYQNIGVTVHNTATVVLILIFTAFFAAFINNIIRSREASIISERDKVVAIVNNLVDGIILLDRNGRVMLINPYAQRILRIQAQQFLKNRFHASVFPKELRPLIHFINSALQEPVYESAELEIQEDGEHVIVQATALQVTDSTGDNVGSLVILRNITKERDLDQMKSDFISVAAHQLRTPLATLKWLFKMLLDGDGGPLNQRQQDLLGKGYARNDEVIEIVNNLLDVSEIEDGRFPYKFTECSLLELVQSVVEDAKVNAQRRQVTIQLHAADTIPAIKIDRQKMRMAVQNLIDNAVKYSHPNTAVEVALNNVNDDLVLAVRDHGIGMTEETQEKIFTKFFRGREAAIKDPTGSGLGLYIVRNIIEKHGGSIHFESTFGKGTTFTTRLPIT